MRKSERNHSPVGNHRNPRCAFYGCPNLTQVTLPDSLQTIDIHAFYGCDRLAQINLPSSICFIENHEFRTYDDILEDDIVIPGLVVTVAPGTYAAQYCREQGIPYEYAK